MVCLGDSLTAGYGLDPAQAYPALLQKSIDDLGWKFKVVNAGLSGETTAGGLRRLDWVLKRRIDVLVLALGGKRRTSWHPSRNHSSESRPDSDANPRQESRSAVGCRRNAHST